MGRRKISIAPIADDRNRSVTFLKRKNGLFKKAYELGILCSAEVAVVVFSNTGKLFEFSSGDMDSVLLRYAKHSDLAHERRGPADYATEDVADIAARGLGGKMTILTDGDGAGAAGAVAGEDDAEDGTEEESSGEERRTKKQKKKKAPVPTGRKSAGQSGARRDSSVKSERSESVGGLQTKESSSVDATPSPMLGTVEAQAYSYPPQQPFNPYMPSVFQTFPPGPMSHSPPTWPFPNAAPPSMHQQPPQGFPPGGPSTDRPPHPLSSMSHPHFSNGAERSQSPASMHLGGTWNFAPHPQQPPQQGDEREQQRQQQQQVPHARIYDPSLVPPPFLGPSLYPPGTDFVALQEAYLLHQQRQQQPQYSAGPGAGTGGAPEREYSPSRALHPAFVALQGHGQGHGHGNRGSPRRRSDTGDSSTTSSLSEPSVPSSAGASELGRRNSVPKPRLSVSIPPGGEEGARRAATLAGGQGVARARVVEDRGGEEGGEGMMFTDEPEGMDGPESSLTALPVSGGSRFAADLLPSPSGFLNNYSAHYSSGLNTAIGIGDDERPGPVFAWPHAAYRPAPALTGEEAADLIRVDGNGNGTDGGAVFQAVPRGLKRGNEELPSPVTAAGREMELEAAEAASNGSGSERSSAAGEEVGGGTVRKCRMRTG